MDQAQQQVLGAEVIVVEHPRLFLGQDNHPPRLIGKPLKHTRRLSPPSQPQRGASRTGTAATPARTAPQ